LIITTRLRANSAKETRIYRIGGLADTSPDHLVRVITHTVRPWSWRGQTMEIDDLSLRAGGYCLLQFEDRQNIRKLFLEPRELRPDDRLFQIYAP
jgi:hypothetical protein